MNKKILGLIAASVTVFGTAITATPARANVEQEVDVIVNVAPALFLRTFNEVTINVTANGTDSSAAVDVTGSSNVDSLTQAQLTTGGPGSLDSVSSIDKNIPNLYAVWGNSGNVDVTVEPTSGNDILTLEGNVTAAGLARNARITVTDGGVQSAPLNPTFPVTGGADLTIEFGNGNDSNSFTSGANASAGRYSGGSLTVRAVQQ